MKKLILFILLAAAALSIKAQDTIYTIKGVVIPAKVHEITDNAVRYQRASNPDGPMYVMDKKFVVLIHYRNGSKDVFQSEEQPDQVQQPAQKQHAENKTPDGYFDDVYNQGQQDQSQQTNVTNNYYTKTGAGLNFMIGMSNLMWGYNYYTYQPYLNYYGSSYYSPLGNVYYGNQGCYGYGYQGYGMRNGFGWGRGYHSAFYHGGNGWHGSGYGNYGGYNHGGYGGGHYGGGHCGGHHR